ncbi:uracil phosphoribosyltransferase [Basidiobolus meristosporus CBS 931.73]|uniref:uracil phosphoribosyltransferase n=1 Tax=Basidiobolus meristosporus CBS 931.73 TaxID=1314790 RepID=A0A1Y1YX78_9FUNG|nr:uracil phosphoribosyltransferase [Basidiobolus meristosporus CBS 931.73]|eukprot:ORY02642.1 uracil phosphoribosyltransferase [Basidiobolus meristosporus CBS 931.73]
MPNHTISKHPLIAHKLSLLRDKNTKAKQSRELLEEIAYLLAYESMQDLEMKEIGQLESPLAPYTGEALKDKIGLVPILRSGLGLVNGFLTMVPSARILHLGLYREQISLQPVEYYNKLPKEPNVDLCVVLDPMVATGGTSVEAISILKDWGIKRIKFVCVCASKIGLDALHEAHPDVTVYAGAIDDTLSKEGYIIPGFGDCGDRIYQTNH